MSNVGARTERGKAGWQGGEGRNSLFEGELVVGLLDLRRVGILLDPAEFASIREKASGASKNGGGRRWLPEEVVAVVLVAVDGVGGWEEEGDEEEEEEDGERSNGSHGLRRICLAVVLPCAAPLPASCS
jgi:hypothetical protein